MRQLKNFMKAKKPMWNCGECKCITLQCWRDNDEFCNCGENVTPPTPPTPTTYTVSFSCSPELGWTTSISELEVDGWTAIAYSWNWDIIIWDTEIAAIPEDWYVFTFWSDENGNELPHEVTWNMAVVANFYLVIPIESITAPDDSDVSTTVWEFAETYFHFSPVDATDVADRIVVTNNTGNAFWYISSYNANWECQIRIEWMTEWSDTITYSLDNVSYDIAVTVTPPL